MAVQLWQVVVWVLGIPYVGWYLWQELLAGMRQAKRERVERMVEQGMMNFPQWKKCISCGKYERTRAKACTDHEKPSLMLPISDGRMVRVCTVLVSDAVIHRLPESERTNFGGFFLQLEDIVGCRVTSEQALRLYNQRKDANTQPVERTSND